MFWLDVLTGCLPLYFVYPLSPLSMNPVWTQCPHNSSHLLFHKQQTLPPWGPWVPLHPTAKQGTREMVKKKKIETFKIHFAQQQSHCADYIKHLPESRNTGKCFLSGLHWLKQTPAKTTVSTMSVSCSAFHSSSLTCFSLWSIVVKDWCMIIICVTPLEVFLKYFEKVHSPVFTTYLV